MRGKKLEPLEGFIDSWVKKLDIGWVRFVEWQDKKDVRVGIHFYNGTDYTCIESIRYPEFNTDILINSLRNQV